MINFLLFVILMNGHTVIRASTIKTVELETDQVAKVQTALGIATILQTPDRPVSVVLGDQDSFKMEYLDKGVAIKPLHQKAETNLYIFTESRRFDVRIHTGKSETADYVVYLKPKSAKENFSLKTCQDKIQFEEFVFTCQRFGLAKQNVLIEFTIEIGSKDPKDSRELYFKPDWLWVKQGKNVRPIEQIFLSDKKVAFKRPIKGVIQLLRKDLNSSDGLIIELKNQQIKQISFRKERLWG